MADAWSGHVDTGRWTWWERLWTRRRSPRRRGYTHPGGRHRIGTDPRVELIRRPVGDGRFITYRKAA